LLQLETITRLDLAGQIVVARKRERRTDNVECDVVVVKVTPEMIHNWDGSSRLALEAKLILKPDRFTSMQAFRDFGKIVQKMAKKVGVGFVADPEAGLRPKIREIVFGDTPDFRLYNNAFIAKR
jgi:hypothetical protein